MTAPTGPLDLISAFAAAAREPHILPVPAPAAELDTVRRGWRRVAQARFDVEGLPRELRKVA